MSDQQVLENLGGNTLEPVSAPRTAIAATLACELAEKPDLGMSPWLVASPRTWMFSSLRLCIVCGTTGAQLPSVSPAISQMRPAFWAGITLQASTFSTTPSISTVMAAG